MHGVTQQALLPGIKPKKTGEPAPEQTAAGEPPEAAAKKNALMESTADVANSAWPPMTEMLHSLLVFESTAHRSSCGQEKCEEIGDVSDESMSGVSATTPVVVMGVDSGCAALSEAQQQFLANADLLCAGRGLTRDLAAEIVRPSEGDSEGLLLLSSPLEPVLERIAQASADGLRVLVLADGDPLFFGIGVTLARYLGGDAVHVIPAVSCLQLACARLNLPWHNVVCLSLHGQDNFGPLDAAVGRGAPLCVLTDGNTRPDTLARHLLDCGVDWFFAHIFERLNLPEETATHVTLDKAAGMSFGPSCTLVLTLAAAPRRPSLGLDSGDLAAEDGIVTKPSVRAAVLALLRIAPTHTVWDIGSGSGAVAIEASVLAHQGRVVAVEKKPERALCIEENRRRFGAAIVDVHLGEAPACLDELPDPQRVFIGGGISGKDGEEVLMRVSRRLPPGGRVAINCVLLSTLARCRDFFGVHRWPCDIVSVQAAESRPLAGDVHLTAMNPIFALVAQKPPLTS
ncbi:MAG: precorrin-6y C5,15-methyltransferase (decarboxylating) subunit CbiE [Desulfovibrio sp.]|nr:precorrin-6y C5,15-methyltransferase (decarboxylating) subunit CbiE [Desulfovibrio sp.]